MKQSNTDQHMKIHVRKFLLHAKSAMTERNRKDVLANLSPTLAGKLHQEQTWIKEKVQIH